MTFFSRIMTNQFSGVYTALSTPMNKGLVSYEGLEALIEHQLNGGINGLVAVGTTGESPTLNNDEHIAVVKATVKLVNGKVPVVAGTGSNSTDEAIKLTQMADTAGADAFLVVAPYYNKPSQEGLFQHFSHIASVTDKPIILYSIPSRCGIEISVDITARLYEKYPHICCMKAAEGSCEKVIDYIRTLGPEFAVMSGDDGLTLPFMSVGATGVISVASNLIVSPLIKMVEAAQANDYTTAQEIFLKFYPFFKAIFTEPNPVPIKYALKSAGVIFDDSVRSPLSQLQADTRKKIDTLVDELDLIK